MKDFFKRYSYTAFKLFLNQFAIALFGVGLAFACSGAGKNGLLLATSIGAVVFYLFLQYTVMWEVGAKDGISATARGTSRGLWRGFAIGGLANSLNLLCALFILPRAFAAAGTALYRIGGAFQFIARMLQGMYMGIMTRPFHGAQLHDFAWVYFVITLPAILVCGLAYIIGSYNLHATNILIPKNKDVKNNGRPE
ncbi:MAG: hypothetical protein J6B09_03695 [Clostridia bacterium]|nr:hypothetical protein [Clostridia bacterium]